MGACISNAHMDINPYPLPQQVIQTKKSNLPKPARPVLN